MYQAMLWPPALIALALAATHAMPDAGWTRKQGLVGTLAIVVVIATGHLSLGLGLRADLQPHGERLGPSAIFCLSWQGRVHLGGA